MKRLLLVSVVLAMVLMVSCQSVTFEGLQMSKDLPNYTVVGEFEQVIKDPHLLGLGASYGLIPFGQPDKAIFDAIRAEIDKLSGDAAIGVSISYGYSFLDALLNGVTSFIYSPRRITITGKVVKFSG